MIWAERDGEWIETARVGEVGGNTLGFYGGKFAPDGKSIMGHGYQGAFHIWRVNKVSCVQYQTTPDFLKVARPLQELTSTIMG